MVIPSRGCVRKNNKGDDMNTRRSGWLAIAGRSVAMTLAVFSLVMAGSAEAAKGGGGKPGGGGGGGGGGGKVKLPAVSLSPTNLDFGDQQEGTTSAPRAVILSNSGRAELTVSSISVTVGSPTYTQSNDCGLTLAPGADCTISVTFGPTAEGPTNGTLEVASNAGSTPDLVALSGNGTAVPAFSTRVEGAGDSIMRGYNASCMRNDIWGLLCYSGGDQEEHSFLDGWDTAVTSLVDYYVQIDPGATGGKAASESGSEMLDPGKNNFATQASAIVLAATQPVRVFVELGGNDLCNRATVNDLYTDAQWTTAVMEGLDILTEGLPDGSTVLMVSVPRVQDLRAVGIAKQNSTSGVNCESFWNSFDVCPIATSTDANFVELDERQKAYNQLLVTMAADYNGRAGVTGVEVVAEFDPNDNASVGSYAFQPDDINGGDCFHPSIQGQNKLSEIIWGKAPR